MTQWFRDRFALPRTLARRAVRLIPGGRTIPDRLMLPTAGPRPAFPPPHDDAEVRSRPTVRLPSSADTRGVPGGPIFVGGTGRSGTWMMGSLLRRHPKWTCVHTELRFHAEDQRFARVLSGDERPEEFADWVISRMFRVSGGRQEAKGLQLILASHELRSCLRDFVQRAETDRADALGQLLLDVVEPYALGRSAFGWSETTPDNAASADALLTALPSAKLVHTVRDGRDVAASVVSMAWGPSTLEDAMAWWAERLVAAHAATAAADPARIHTVRLEEFVHLTREQSFEELVAFLGFVDPTQMREHFDTAIHAERGHVGRWRSPVDAARRDRVDGMYRDLLAQMRDAGVTCLPTDPDEVDALARHQTGLTNRHFPISSRA